MLRRTKGNADPKESHLSEVSRKTEPELARMERELHQKRELRQRSDAVRKQAEFALKRTMVELKHIRKAEDRRHEAEERSMEALQALASWHRKFFKSRAQEADIEQFFLA